MEKEIRNYRNSQTKHCLLNGALTIASDFNISVASVYNYKTRSVRAGAAIPTGKRGRKPKSVTLSDNNTSKNLSFRQLPVSVKMESYYLIINGVKVSVSGNARTVHIDDKHMVINF